MVILPVLFPAMQCDVQPIDLLTNFAACGSTLLLEAGMPCPKPCWQQVSRVQRKVGYALHPARQAVAADMPLPWVHATCAEMWVLPCSVQF